MDNTLGWAFERCCRRWTAVYADEQVTGAPRRIGSWRSRDGQKEIDVVGTSRYRYTLLGACKWRRVADIDVLGQLHEHQAALGGHAAAARLIIYGQDQFIPALRERAVDGASAWSPRYNCSRWMKWNEAAVPCPGLRFRP